MRLSNEVLRHALIGYEGALAEVNGKIAHLRTLLGAAPVSNPGSRPMSRAARKRISEAQKRRWAAYRRRHAA